MPRKSPVRCQCHQCGQPFEALDYRATRPPKFCSRQCRDAARRTKVTLACRQCQNPFLRKAYQENWSQERGPFCSMACYGEWQREHTAGPANPNWAAQSAARGAGQWERNRVAALERDGYQCRDCGATGPRLVVHHVIPWKPGHSDPHALDNLRTLCAGCHQRTHAAIRAASTL